MTYTSRKLEDIRHSIKKEKASILRIRVLRVVIGILILIIAYLLTNDIGIYSWLGAIFIIFIIWAYISSKLSERCKMVEHLKNLELMHIEEKEDDLFREEGETSELALKSEEKEDDATKDDEIKKIEDIENIENNGEIKEEKEDIDILNSKKE
ncbi:hypothetical protein J3E07_000442 [Methanococcus voltae]|uniref:Uncharacterized protein n=1 Tax=Methanococcus voltae TaxID=2188 RepID=A0A8J7RF35_METVO|nr:hypothetical protein [Methanococcus voltae]MBP2201044.1 hypothetical protein [Methanococcus voltae]